MDGGTFLRDIARTLDCDSARAEAVAFTVLQELRDRLTPREAAHVAAQLPARVKRMWLERERPDRRVEKLHRQEFVGRVRLWAGLPDDGEGERAVKAVFHELQLLLGSPHGTEGEAWDILSQLPKDLKVLWLEAASPPAPRAS